MAFCRATSVYAYKQNPRKGKLLGSCFFKIFIPCLICGTCTCTVHAVYFYDHSFLFVPSLFTRYVIYFLLDSTAGLLFIYLQVRIAQRIFIRCACKALMFGEYGDPPKWDAWIGQCGVFIIIVIIEKIGITLLTFIPFWTKVRHCDIISFVKFTVKTYFIKYF